jgi:hypothetical protein
MPSYGHGQPPFIVLALPRSRTYWLSKFLSYHDWHCGHDELRYTRGLDDVKAWFDQRNTGTVETGAAPWWRLLREYAPEARIAVVRRPVGEVVDSLMRVPGCSFNQLRISEQMKRLDGKLDQIEARIEGVRSFLFNRLVYPSHCRDLFEFCLPYRFNREWWSDLDGENLQCSLPAMIRYAKAYAPQLEKLAKIAKFETISLISRQIPTEIEGVTLQTEAFEPWFADAQRLFAAHLVQVGEAPDDFLNKNLPLMRDLDRLARMQIVTARSNGRMFGYLMTILSPSLESADVLTSIHTTFFASKDFPMLGLKLQRYAVEQLRVRGVSEAYMRSGPRGDGPKMGSLYRRLGAVPDGELFKLEIEAP